MNLIFHIDYYTRPGESLRVRFLNPNLSDRQIPMTCEGSSMWRGVVSLPDECSSFVYCYELIDQNGKLIRSEYGEPHFFVKNGNIAEVEIVDRWQDIPADKPFYSTVFTDCIFNRKDIKKNFAALTGYISLSVKAPRIATDQIVALTGNIDQLGNWDPTKALVLNDSAAPIWRIQFPYHQSQKNIEYKFIVLDSKTKRLICWERGDNRRIDNAAAGFNRHTAIDCGELNADLTLWRGAGTAIPVFSVRTEKDFGVGDFYSLLKMIDWCNLTGQKILQLLPINDTTMSCTWTDCYPYNANSTFALHPMYLHVQAIGTLRDSSRRAYFAKMAEDLNRLPVVDYERVNRLKDAYIREIYTQDRITVMATDDFKQFFNGNAYWLKPYAAFRVLRDRFKTADFSRWEEYSSYDPVKIERFCEENAIEIGYHLYVQYFLDRQMRHVREYAHKKGVAIKGDIPIGISRTSVDAWTTPRLFNLDCQAGAPPDAFSILGQNWGFPTYNWEEMSKDGFEWWKSRFRKMSEYFDAYRIDHVLGFFRIWQIPQQSIHGLLGYFNPALPFTVDELRKRYSFEMDVDKYCRPFITEEVVASVFGDNSGDVKNAFLHLIDENNQRYALIDSLNTQRKIAEYFGGQPKNDRNTAICEGLLNLLDNVLFIEDPAKTGHYHPRIIGQQTYIYNSLSKENQERFNRLYEDFFYHRHNDFWREKAMMKLPPLIDATRMLVCAEDLGMIPACVPSVMHDLEILSLEIQRMPKAFNVRFDNPAKYPYYSVCTTSTHDMGGIRQWWEENADSMSDFFNHCLACDGPAPKTATPYICKQIVDQHLASPAMLCILPLQDWLSTDERLRRDNPRDEQINNPADPHHYWRYRMHLSVEQLIDAKAFNEKIREQIKFFGR